jgi:hypothetical protein
MPDSTLNRRSVALYVAEPTQFSYPQETAQRPLFPTKLFGDYMKDYQLTKKRLKRQYVS